jgi:transposase
MGEYIGLDVSLKETAISVRRDGKRIWRGKCPSDPSLIAEVVRERAPRAQAGGLRDRSFIGVVLSCTER